jgi:molecular chaperone Hsp33
VVEEKPDSGAGVLIAGLADEPSARWAAVDLCGPLREACDRLDLSPVAAGALGRCLAGAVLLQRLFIKTPGRLVLAISGSGPLSRVLGEVDEGGRVRGMVSDPHVEIPVGDPTTLGVSRAIGDGLLQVLRDVRGGGYQSQVQVSKGRIGAALARFLEQSEQTRSAVLLGVLAERDGVRSAGGLIIEALPGAEEGAVLELESRIETVASVSRRLAEGGVLGLLDELFGKGSYRVGDSTRIEYRCRCSESSIRSYLQQLDGADLGELENSPGEVVADCVFCGARYRFDRKSLEEGRA